MKRTTMRNAPNLPRIASQVSATATEAQHHTTPASPVVGDLRSRLQGMKGNSITLPVCGRDVTFTLETVPAERVEKATMVWIGNERDQDLLTHSALDDLIPSFLTSGQQNPAFGRRVSGIIEVADGSRRRQAAIFTASEYRILVGELDEEQMSWLSQTGNDYRPTSAYERGKRYERRLANEFDGNVSQLSEAEGVDRKIITRCVNTAQLPFDVISLFSHPGELSARAGDSLSKAFKKNENALLEIAKKIQKNKSNGDNFTSDKIINMLLNSVKEKAKLEIKKTVFAKGATAKYHGDMFTAEIDTTKVPRSIVAKIESILLSYSTEESETIEDKVNKDLSSIEFVINSMKSSADELGINLTEGNIRGHIPVAQKILKLDATEEERMKLLKENIRTHFGK